MRIKNTAFLASSLILIIIILINLFFVYVFQRSSWFFPLDSNLQKHCDENVEILRYYMADYDESDLTGECSDNRRAVYYKDGIAKFVGNDQMNVPAEVLEELKKLSDIHSRQYRIADRSLRIGEEEYLLSGRAMGKGDSLVFRGYLTKRDYFIENAQEIFGRQVSLLSSEYSNEVWERIEGTFYLIDKQSGKFTKLYGTGKLTPDMPEDKYFKISSPYVLVDGLEVAILYSLSYSESYFEQAIIRMAAFIFILIIMNVLYFRKK